MFKISQKKMWAIILVLIFFLFTLWKNRSINLIQDSDETKPFISQKYEEILKKISTKKNEDINKIEKFIIDNQNIYGTLASMFLAKKYVSDNNLEKAIKQLENSLKYTKDEILKNILLLKIVSLEIEQNHNQRALHTLNKVNDENWINIIHRLKGDIFEKEGFLKDAIKEWKKSQFTEESNIYKKIIDMKIKNLIGKI